MLKFLGIFSIAILLISCTSDITDGFFDADNAHINYIGRFDFSNPKNVRYDWSGVQIKTVFSGTSISIKLKDGTNDYNIFIDDQFYKVLHTTADTIYSIAVRLENKRHTFLLTKRTEAIFGIAEFNGFILDKTGKLFDITTVPERKIEFIGDSFVAGFGSEGKSPDCKFSRETEDNYVTYGPVLARMLDADYSIVAISGIGVVRNYADSLTASLNPLPFYYERACMNDTVRWQFKKWQPDLVVVRLGRNDYWKRPFPPRSEFRTAYLDLLKKIRGVYPKAYILALCGPIRKDPHCTYINSAVSEMENKMKDKRIKFLKLVLKLNPKKDFGCQKHPNASGHKKIADVLEPVIHQWLKWE